jgi:TrmH family RNA methyltransferase
VTHSFSSYSGGMLDNPRSPKVRAVAKLAKKERRAEAGLFLVEGPQSLREALVHRPELIVDVFVTQAAKDRNSDVVALAADNSLELTVCTEAVIEQMADTVTPQGVVAVCAYMAVSLDAVIAQAPSLVAVLHEVRDPGNVGNIIRTADAAGAGAVIVTKESVDVFNPKVVRATTGSIFHLPIVIGVDLETTIVALKKAGLRVLAADAQGENLVDVREAGVLALPTAWLLGNEAHGLSDEDEILADAIVSVPIYGQAESLSLPTAAAVCLYESAIAQHTTR